MSATNRRFLAPRLVTFAVTVLFSLTIVWGVLTVCLLVAAAHQPGAPKLDETLPLLAVLPAVAFAVKRFALEPLSKVLIQMYWPLVAMAVAGLYANNGTGAFLNVTGLPPMAFTVTYVLATLGALLAATIAGCHHKEQLATETYAVFVRFERALTGRSAA